MSDATEEVEGTTERSKDDLGKAKIKFESGMPLKEAVSYFEAIVAGLRQGTLHFKQGEKSLTVSPASHLEVEVRAARKGRQEKISFELSWRHSEPADLEISAK